MHPHLRLDPLTGAMPMRRSRLRVAGVVLATLLLLGLAQLPASAHGQLLSPTPATTAPRTGITLPLAEAPPRDHDTTVAGIPTPLAVPVGAIILVLVILLAITALTRGRHDDDDDDRAFLDPET